MVKIVWLQKGSRCWPKGMKILQNFLWVPYKPCCNFRSLKQHSNPFCSLNNPYSSKHTGIWFCEATESVQKLFERPKIIQKGWYSTQRILCECFSFFGQHPDHFWSHTIPTLSNFVHESIEPSTSSSIFSWHLVASSQNYSPSRPNILRLGRTPRWGSFVFV